MTDILERVGAVSEQMVQYRINKDELLLLQATVLVNAGQYRGQAGRWLYEHRRATFKCFARRCCLFTDWCWNRNKSTLFTASALSTLPLSATSFSYPFQLPLSATPFSYPFHLPLSAVDLSEPFRISYS